MVGEVEVVVVESLEVEERSPSLPWAISVNERGRHFFPVRVSYAGTVYYCRQQERNGSDKSILALAVYETA
jgi:hypothetical protein